MEIHRLLKQFFDNDEKYSELPRVIKIAYIEIENHVKNKINKNSENKENKENKEIKTISEYNEEIKKDFENLKGKLNNAYSFSAYSQKLLKLNINKIITTKNLYNNFNKENLFIYLYNYTIKNLSVPQKYDILDKFKKFVLSENIENIELLKFIFLNGENVLAENFNKKIRPNESKFIIKIENIYYIEYKDNKQWTNINNLILMKLKPKKDKDLILFHLQEFENEKVPFIINRHPLYPIEKKAVCIEIYDDFYFVQEEK